MQTKIALIAAAAMVVATPALAVTNVIKNGSFETSTLGGTQFGAPPALPNWTLTNRPASYASIVIGYNNTQSYTTGGAFNENVFADNAVSQSPDAVGSRAAYFVSDVATNETLSQMTYLSVGNYRVGFSSFLTQNGIRNRNNASLAVTILNTPVTATSITSSSAARTWVHQSAVANISVAGWYTTSLVYNSNGNPAKDIVVDRVYGIRTNDAATVFVPPTTVFAVPEPATWAMLVAGFGLVGFGMRRRRPTAVAA